MVGGVLRAKLTMFEDVVTVMIRLTAMPGELWSISLVGCIKIRFGVFVGEIIEKRRIQYCHCSEKHLEYVNNNL